MTKVKIIENIEKIGIDYATAIVMPTNNDWQSVPANTKLSIFQKTPEKVVKTRKVGSQDVAYVSI
jgi:hypothetical protein